RHFIFRGWAEKVWNTRQCGFALFTTNLDEIALTQIAQLNVITVAQKGPRVSANAEAQWAGNVASQADDREIVSAAKVRCVRGLHLVHSSQECDSLGITATYVEKKSPRIVVLRRNFVTPTVAFDRNNGVGLWQDKLFWWRKWILEVPRHLLGGT